MLLVFIDESSDEKFKEYLGLCCAVVNSRFYGPIKQRFQAILQKGGWSETIEFKGQYLFSATRGDTSVGLDKRIDMASQIIALTASKTNSRMTFVHAGTKTKDQKAEYLSLLPDLLKRALPRAGTGPGKNLITLHCDCRSDISCDQIRQAVSAAIKTRGYTLVEDIVQSRSGFHTVGILFADIVGYLAARYQTISTDSELFVNLSPEQLSKNGKYRKLTTSTNLLGLIKRFRLFEVK